MSEKKTTDELIDERVDEALREFLVKSMQDSGSNPLISAVFGSREFLTMLTSLETLASDNESLARSVATLSTVVNQHNVLIEKLSTAVKMLLDALNAKPAPQVTQPTTMKKRSMN